MISKTYYMDVRGSAEYLNFNSNGEKPTMLELLLSKKRVDLRRWRLSTHHHRDGFEFISNVERGENFLLLSRKDDVPEGMLSVLNASEETLLNLLETARYYSDAMLSGDVSLVLLRDSERFSIWQRKPAALLVEAVYQALRYAGRVKPSTRVKVTGVVAELLYVALNSLPLHDVADVMCSVDIKEIIPLFTALSTRLKGDDEKAKFVGLCLLTLTGRKFSNTLDDMISRLRDGEFGTNTQDTFRALAFSDKIPPAGYLFEGGEVNLLQRLTRVVTPQNTACWVALLHDVAEDVGMERLANMLYFKSCPFHFYRVTALMFLWKNDVIDIHKDFVGTFIDNYTSMFKKCRALPCEEPTEKERARTFAAIGQATEIPYALPSVFYDKALMGEHLVKRLIRYIRRQSLTRANTVLAADLRSRGLLDFL